MLFERLRVAKASEPHCSREATVYFCRGLYIMGLRFPKRNLYRFPLYLYSLFVNFVVTFYFPLSFFLSYKFRFSEFDLQQFLTSLQVSTNLVASAIKVLILAIQQKHLHEAVAHMDKLDERATEPQERRKIQEMCTFGNRAFCVFNILYWAFSMSTFVGASIRGLPPYAVYYPYLNWKNNKMEFCIQSFLETNSMNFLVFQEGVMDSYPVIYINILRAHVQLLAERVKRVSTNTEGLNNNDRYEALIQCILDHKVLLELFSKIGEVISGTIFVQFLFVGLIVGLALINIVLYADVPTAIGALFFIFSALFETFPCCYYANCLMDDSDELALSLFHCAWEEQDQRYKKALAFFMQNTQRTMTLTAMKLLPISMASNLNVAKFAFSIYTLISRVDFNKRFLKDSANTVT